MDRSHSSPNQGKGSRDDHVQSSAAEPGRAFSTGGVSDSDLRWAGLAAEANAETSRAGDHAGDLSAPFQGDASATRVASTRRGLDDALAAWLSAGAMPDPALLRDGLLLLNAGTDVDDAQRALLLRAALHHRRGALTALSHQVDAERTALILHDAIVDPASSLSLLDLERLLDEDLGAEEWDHYLHAELLGTAESVDPYRRQRAEDALALMDEGVVSLEVAVSGASPEGVDAAEGIAALDIAALNSALDDRGRLPRTPIVAGILLMVVLALMLAALWQYERSRTAGMIEAPFSVFSLPAGNGSTRDVVVDAFLIDSMETTNAQYRRCVRRGACLPPTANHSAARVSYYDDPAFGDYPVIFVDHGAARAYCAWAGKRLPSFDEWQLAAGLAPATQRIYVYPWGDRYTSGAANDANAIHGDSLAVGEYRSAGDSPLGLSDMAGNVAEWTATAGATSPVVYWAKGGSFVDDADQLRIDGGVILPPETAVEWLGFRCATTSLWSALARQFQKMASTSASD